MPRASDVQAKGSVKEASIAGSSGGISAAGPICPSLPWCFSSAGPAFDWSCARRQQASWQPAVQEGEQMEGLKLVLA